MARKHQCEGIICGHIHVCADRMIGKVRYLNSGDWVESNTGIVENLDGEMKLFSYEEFAENLAPEISTQAVEKPEDSQVNLQIAV